MKPKAAASAEALGLKGTLLALAILSLLGILSVTAMREATTTGREPITAGRAVANPPKPAFTRAEETYIQALWPIHGDVERSAVRLSLGRIFYKIDDIGKSDLKARVDASLAAFRRAEERIQALQPPPSLAGGTRGISRGRSAIPAIGAGNPENVR